MVVRNLRRFVAEREWEPFHDPKCLSMAVASEAGELLAEYRWVSTEEADRYSMEPEHRERIQAEIADVGITLLLLCDRIGVDLINAIQAKIIVNGKNYPAEKARGRRERARPLP